jgi:hypothetical protein
VSLPNYSALEAAPSRRLPDDLRRQEDRPEFLERSLRIDEELLKPERRPDQDKPLFIACLAKGHWPVTLTLRDGPCLLAFTSPIRAADYARAHLQSIPELTYLSSTPRQFVRMLGDLRPKAKIRHFALDRCPRCDIVLQIDLEGSEDASRAITVWANTKSTEIARYRLYLEYARSAAQKQEWTTARDVALEIVGHVTPEPPHVHLLLGKLAVVLRDDDLWHGAEAWLKYLNHSDLFQELRTAKETGLVQF